MMSEKLPTPHPKQGIFKFGARLGRPIRDLVSPDLYSVGGSLPDGALRCCSIDELRGADKPLKQEGIRN